MTKANAGTSTLAAQRAIEAEGQMATAGAAELRPQALLLDLCGEHRRLNAEYRALDAMGDAADEAYESLAARLAMLAEQAISTRATTVEELKAKAGLLTDLYAGEAHCLWSGGGTSQTTDTLIVDSILRDLGVMCPSGEA